MSIRKLNLPDDLDLVIELLVDTFKYPDNPEWHTGSDEIQGYQDLIAAAKRFWPILSVLRTFSSYIRNVFTGLIWEQDGKPVGIIALQRLPREGEWYGRSLGILPEYRRLGIGLKLVNATLDMIRELDGKRAYLLVIDGNKPASNLYHQMGFIDYAGEVVLEHPGTQLPDINPSAEHFTVQERTAKEWQSAYQYACNNIPDHIKEFESPHIQDFKTPLYQRLIVPYFEKAQGVDVQNFVYRTTKSDQIEGQATVELRIKEGGAVLASASSTPNNPAMAQYILQHILTLCKKYSPNRRIRMDLPGWKTEIIQAAIDAGFEKKLVYRKMVYNFD